MAKDTVQIIRDHIVKEFLYDKPGIVLDDDFHLIQEGVVDSLGIMRLVGFLEETFAIQVRPEDVVVDNFGTIKAIEAFVDGKRGASPQEGTKDAGDAT